MIKLQFEQTFTYSKFCINIHGYGDIIVKFGADVWQVDLCGVPTNIILHVDNRSRGSSDKLGTQELFVSALAEDLSFSQGKIPEEPTPNQKAKCVTSIPSV